MHGFYCRPRDQHPSGRINPVPLFLSLALSFIDPQIQIAGGYAHLFTGPFLKEATPGQNYSYPYVMVTYVFLSER